MEKLPLQRIYRGFVCSSNCSCLLRKSRHFEGQGKRVEVIGQDTFATKSPSLGHFDAPDAVLHLEFKAKIFEACTRSSLVIFEGFLCFFDVMLAAACDVRLDLVKIFHCDPVLTNFVGGSDGCCDGKKAKVPKFLSR